jgi:hypothetical protein
MALALAIHWSPSSWCLACVVERVALDHSCMLREASGAWKRNMFDFRDRYGS